jgi:hypothetical protein
LDSRAKHEASFSYSLNLIRNLVGNYVLIKAVAKFNRWVGLSVFGFDYRREDLSVRLLAVIKRFIESADAKGTFPVIAFIPLNGYDRTSPNSFIAEIKPE